MFPILEKREVAPNLYEIVIEAPAIAAKAQPGQFAIAMVDRTSERVPYTLIDWDADAGTVTLIVQEVGRSSRKMAIREVGETVDHLVGPMGFPLEIAKFGTVVLAGGCYGVGAILNVARAMKAAGNHVVVIVEARSHYLHYYADHLNEASDEFIQTTIDGSEGVRGHAVDALKHKLTAGETVDRVIAIGCPFTMMLIAEATRSRKIATLTALNPIMLDGTGMCGACRVTVGNEMKFACVDGPFFDAHQVDWQELWHRRAAYGDEEIDAVAGTAPVQRRGGGASQMDSW